MKTYLENIKRIRNIKGYSQEYMAEKLGIAPANYGKIERGITQMTIDKLQSIANILEGDIIVLLGGNTITIDEAFDYEELLKRQKIDHDLIEDLTTEMESLKRQNNEKALLIDMLLKEKMHNKSSLTSHLNSTCYWGVKDIDEKLSENINERQIEKLNFLRGYIINYYKTAREYFIKVGWLDKSDFEKEHASESRLYKDMPEHEILG